MFLAIALKSYNGAIYHLFSHAFFKALLFLCAGVVIHALNGEQNIKKMAKSIGYSLTNRGAKDVTPGDKLQERFTAIQAGVKTLQENYL